MQSRLPPSPPLPLPLSLPPSLPPSRSAVGEGHQACAGAGRHDDRDGGRCGGGGVCVALPPLHAEPQVHHGQRSGQRLPAAARQDHRVHQHHRPRSWTREGGGGGHVGGASLSTVVWLLWDVVWW